MKISKKLTQTKPSRRPFWRRKRAAVLALVLVGVVTGLGCMQVTQIPVKGRLEPYALETTVDDESARYYLESYLAGQVADTQLHQRITAVHGTFGDRLPTREQLKQLSDEFSVDFAALVFGRQLLRQPGNPELQRQFLKHLEQVQQGQAAYPARDVLILMVPGYGYVENGQVTGADLANPRKLLQQAGYDVELVAIDQFGSVEANAAYIAQTILKHQRRDLVVTGASSANPAIHLALGKLLKPDQLARVKAWLNLGGILQGVPILEEFSQGPKDWLFSALLWFKGWDRASFESMYTSVSRERFAGLSVPRHIAIYNYLGLSLSGNISDFAWDKYLMMRDDGPNDGLTLLPDILAPNSLSILSPTTDHFFAEDPDIDRKTLALLVTILARLEA